jgi:hypothetical protein
MREAPERVYSAPTQLGEPAYLAGGRKRPVPVHGALAQLAERDYPLAKTGWRQSQS